MASTPETPPSPPSAPEPRKHAGFGTWFTGGDTAKFGNLGRWLAERGSTQVPPATQSPQSPSIPNVDLKLTDQQLSEMAAEHKRTKMEAERQFRATSHERRALITLLKERLMEPEQVDQTAWSRDSQNIARREQFRILSNEQQALRSLIDRLESPDSTALADAEAFLNPPPPPAIPDADPTPRPASDEQPLTGEQLRELLEQRDGAIRRNKALIEARRQARLRNIQLPPTPGIASLETNDDTVVEQANRQAAVKYLDQLEEQLALIDRMPRADSNTPEWHNYRAALIAERDRLLHDGYTPNQPPAEPVTHELSPSQPRFEGPQRTESGQATAADFAVARERLRATASHEALTADARVPAPASVREHTGSEAGNHTLGVEENGATPLETDREAARREYYQLVADLEALRDRLAQIPDEKVRAFLAEFEPKLKAARERFTPPADAEPATSPTPEPPKTHRPGRLELDRSRAAKPPIATPAEPVVSTPAAPAKPPAPLPTDEAAREARRNAKIRELAEALKRPVAEPEASTLEPGPVSPTTQAQLDAAASALAELETDDALGEE